MEARSVTRQWLERLFAIDLRSLAVFRISLAALTLFDLGARSRFIEAGYTDAGVLPGHLFITMPRYISLYWIHPSHAFQCLIFAVAAVAAAALLVGYRTRVATIVTWVLVCAIHTRNVYLTDGGDSVIRALLLWSLFLPLGARFSSDERSGRTALGGKTILSVATACLLLQFVYLYVSAGFSKSGPEWYSLGTAVEQVLSQNYWARPLGQYLSQFPEWLRLATWGTVIFEIVGPLLLFVPFRTEQIRVLVFLAFCGFNLGLGVTIQLNLFPWACVIAAIPFLPSRVWDTLSRGSSSAAGSRSAQEPPRPEASSRSRALRRLRDAAMLAVIAYLGFTAVTSPGNRDPSLIDSIGYRTGIIPYWNMYMTPPTFDVSFQAIGRLENGAAIDLTKAEGGDEWRDVRSIHDYVRFRRYLVQISAPDEPRALKRLYLRWLCRSWNADPSNASRVRHVALMQTRTRIRPPGEPRRHRLARVDCLPAGRVAPHDDPPLLGAEERGKADEAE